MDHPPRTVAQNLSSWPEPKMERSRKDGPHPGLPSLGLRQGWDQSPAYFNKLPGDSDAIDSEHIGAPPYKSWSLSEQRARPFSFPQILKLWEARIFWQDICIEFLMIKIILYTLWIFVKKQNNTCIFWWKESPRESFCIFLVILLMLKPILQQFL